MKKLITGLAAAALSFAASGTALAAPACVDTMLSGLVVPHISCFGNNYRNVTLVIHRKNNSWVSYSAGTITKNSAGNANGSASQLFSDRVVSGQPFNKNAADSHNFTVRASDGQIVITNVTWGFTTTLSNTSCSGNLITASDGGSFYTLSFSEILPVIC